MNKQFLPGPWKVERTVTGKQWIANEWANEDGGDVVCMMPEENMSASRRRWPANSALICAAPEMFELLAELSGYIPVHANLALSEKITSLLTKITTP